jgi:hypothetical protein
VIAEIDVHSGFELEFLGEFRIHAGAGSRQRLEGAGSFEAAVDQHATGRVGGFAAGLSALDDQNGRAAFAQCEGERKADYASADDD